MCQNQQCQIKDVFIVPKGKHFPDSCTIEFIVAITKQKSVLFNFDFLLNFCKYEQLKPRLEQRPLNECRAAENMALNCSTTEKMSQPVSAKKALRGEEPQSDRSSAENLIQNENRGGSGAVGL